ncbi:phasin [Bradyrhizobium sp. Ce-3]|nr:phasin [Bradyrhizobium sp. Ce-3]
MNQGSVIHFNVPGFNWSGGVRNGHIYFTRCEGLHVMTTPSDPFSASIIPFEVPEQMRAFAEKGVLQARDSYAKFKDAAETHNSTVEAVFTSVSKGASEYSAKLIEFFKANTTSSLDFAQELFSVKSPTEAVELWTSHTRKQFETYTAQAKELAELGQKVASETAEPIKASASKFYKPAA